MHNSYKKIILFILIILIVLPPFFDGGRNIFVNEVLLIFTALALLLFGINNKKKEESITKNIWQPPFIFLSIFLFLSLATVFFSTSPYNSLVVWFQYLSYGALFFIVAKFKFEKKEIDIFIKIFLGVSSVLCLIGIYYYLTGSYNRLTSTFWWPNPFAGYLLFSLPLAMHLFLKSRENSKNIILPGLVLVLLITSFILTGSRGAFISIIIGLLIYFIIDFRRIKKEYFSALLLIVVSFSLVLFFGILKNDRVVFLNRGESSESSLDASSNIRVNYWLASWEIFKEYPMTGSGLNTFRTIYPQFQKNPISAGKYAHNLYLEMLAESGIFILILFIVFLTSIYWIKFKDLNRKEYAFPLYVGTLAFLIHNGVDVDWHYSASTLVFWIFLGLFYNIYNSEYNYKNVFDKISSFISRFKRKHNTRKYSIIKVLIVIVLILLIKGSIFIYSDYGYRKGIEYQSAGKLALAELAFSKSVFFNLNPNYLRQYGIILYSQGVAVSDEIRNEFLNKALAISEKAIKYDQFNSSNYELIGKIYYAQDKIEQAENNFRKSIELNRFSPRYYINLSEILIAQSKKEEAREVIEEILSYYPEDVVNNRKYIIFKDQQITSGIEEEIKYLNYLLQKTY